MLKKNKSHLISAAFFALLITCPFHYSQAYFETLNTAEPVATGKGRALLSPQLMADPVSGVNMNGLFDLGWSDDSDLRMSLGFGKVDFSFGGFYKWAPIPDTANQAGMAIIFGSTYANFADSNEFSLKVSPIISKNIATDYGEICPYLSLPLAMTFRSGDDVFPVNLTVGSKWIPEAYKEKGLSFMAEAGLDLSDSFTYFSLAAVWDVENLPFHQSQP